MEHALSAWRAIAAALGQAGHLLLLADYDGTLAPIAPRPELAQLPLKTGEVLRALAGRRGVSLGIISGRTIGDLKKQVGIPGIIYSGNHGLEIEAPEVSFDFPLARAVKPEVEGLYPALQERLGAIPGALIENKRLSISVHYRAVAPAMMPGLRKAFRRALVQKPLSESLTVTRGKKVYEIRAAGWHKGKAVELLMQGLGSCRHTLTLYLGDDQTDEDAFRAVGDEGVAVRIGRAKGGSAARYFLRSTAETGAFLGMLLEILP